MTLLPASRSISSKLIRMNLLVTATALLLACVAFFSYDLISFQQSLIRSLASEARIVGLNSVSAVLFNDKDSAQTTLAALSSSQDVQGAAIVTNDGKVFAGYRSREGWAMRFPAIRNGLQQQYWISGADVLLAQRIVFQGRVEGTVYIFARLQELGHRARQYLLIALAILAFCLVAAMLLTAAFRRLIAQPIVSLAEMSRAVRDRNYSLRASPSREADEISVLIESFNEMLTQIEQRDSALRQARDELEQRVQERTTELKSANRELEAFSYTVAHDLRGPLDAAIGGICFLLQQGYADNLDAEGREMLDRLRQSSVKMAVLIDDLLNLSRAASSSIERSTVDLSGLVSSIAADLTATEPERNVEFMIARGAIVLADAGLMRVALENLLRNAWKYSSKNPAACIDFGFQRVRDRIVYFVRDNGAGFNPEFADRLFKPFQRLHTQSEFAGTGIGLATVQRIIARHGGKVWAEGVPEQAPHFIFRWMRDGK